MTPTGRRAMFLAAASVVAGVLVWGLTGLPDFGDYHGPYGTILDRVAVGERHGTNVVTAVVFDYRGVDTMIEEYILFASVIGVTLLLRRQRGERERPPSEVAKGRGEPEPSEAARVMGLGLVGPVILLGLYVVAHGALTPGGGFQGGVVLATASGLVFLTGSFLSFERVNPIPLIDLAEGAGAAGYPALGLLGFGGGGAFLTNVLPLGRPGSLLSAGLIPLIDLAVGLAVAAGIVLILSEFLEQTLAIRGSRR